jgi:hypothetical protein
MLYFKQSQTGGEQMKSTAGLFLLWLIFAGDPDANTVLEEEEEEYEIEYIENDNRTFEPWPELINGVEVDETWQQRKMSPSNVIVDDPNTEIWEELANGV